MGFLLVLGGLGGFVLAIVNLIRPLSRLGLVNRRRAVALLGASLLTVLTGAVISQGSPEVGPPGAEATTTPLSETTTTSSPGAGPSGDPDQPPPVDADPATVKFIIDGDTLTVALSDGRNDTVRLIGINTPETGECFADEATDVLAALTPPGSQIAMTVDSSDRGQFDRLLRYLWVGQMSVNEELVRRGAAIARRYPPDTAMADRLESAESASRTAKRGLWSPDACVVSY
jgi:micrococcal nuclease